MTITLMIAPIGTLPKSVCPQLPPAKVPPETIGGWGGRSSGPPGPPDPPDPPETSMAWIPPPAVPGSGDVFGVFDKGRMAPAVPETEAEVPAALPELMVGTAPDPPPG